MSNVRLPVRWWEWALQFVPAAVVLLATAYDAFLIPRGGRMLVGLEGAVVGCVIAIPLCFVAAFFLTRPHPRWEVRTVWVILMALAVAAVNSGIAFGGCMLVMP